MPAKNEQINWKSTYKNDILIFKVAMILFNDVLRNAKADEIWQNISDFIFDSSFFFHIIKINA